MQKIVPARFATFADTRSQFCQGWLLSGALMKVACLSLATFIMIFRYGHLPLLVDGLNLIHYIVYTPLLDMVKSDLYSCLFYGSLGSLVRW